ncbi:MAG: nucleotidyltransferase family protein [Gemmatimonadetes bacterium]|nr:nucleotidyltransferase family protein [Gemmatimonadota bacterium]
MTSSRSDQIAGIVLAAGASTRMSENKLLLELEDETLIERCVKRVLAAELDPVVVVLGYEADLVRRRIGSLPIHVIVNDRYEMGMSSSLGIAVAELGDNVSAVCVVLADMPFVTTKMLREVVSRYRESGAPLVVSRYGSINAPPTLFDHALFTELRASEGEEMGKRLVERYRDAAEIVEWPEAALADVDEPDDYERALKISLQ